MNPRVERELDERGDRRIRQAPLTEPLPLTGERAIRKERRRIAASIAARLGVGLSIADVSVQNVDRLERVQVGDERRDQNRDEVAGERDRAQLRKSKRS